MTSSLALAPIARGALLVLCSGTLETRMRYSSAAFSRLGWMSDAASEYSGKGPPAPVRLLTELTRALHA